MLDLPFGLPVFEQKPLTKAWPGKTRPVVVVRSVEVESLVLGRRFSEQLGGHLTGNFASTELILSLKAKLLPRQNTHFECGIDFLAFCFCETPRESGRWRRLAF